MTWGPDDERLFQPLLNISEVLRKASHKSIFSKNPFPPNLGLIQIAVLINKGIIDENIEDIKDVVEMLKRIMILKIGQILPQTHHRYVYCFNNPVNLIDPLGLVSLFHTLIDLILGFALEVLAYIASEAGLIFLAIGFMVVGVAVIILSILPYVIQALQIFQEHYRYLDEVLSLNTHKLMLQEFISSSKIMGLLIYDFFEKYVRAKVFRNEDFS